jgi:hypothetical protein
VIKRPSDDWRTEELRSELEEERLPPFRSALATETSWRRASRTDSTAELTASLLLRAGDDGLTRAQIEEFFASSFGGRDFAESLPQALTVLSDELFAYVDEGAYRLTVLGKEATNAVIPLRVASGFAQLIRDFLWIDSSDRYLGHWQPIDHLLVLNLLWDGAPKFRRYSANLARQVTDWVESSDHDSMLFTQWIHGQRGHSKADQLSGSLNISPPNDSRQNDDAEWMRQRAYIAALLSIVLMERGRGRLIDDIVRQYDVKNLEGVEERWRDDMLWLLNGLSRILEIRTFYYHLREECKADNERVKRLERLLGRMRRQTYDLQEELKYLSPLGPALRDIRRLAGGGVGVATIRKLESAGVNSLRELYRLGIEGMRAHGVRKDIAKRIVMYLRRRAA